jgi:hypothetical protein
MKYTVEMASDGMIHTPSFMKIGSEIQKLLEEGYTHTNTQAER